MLSSYERDASVNLHKLILYYIGIGANYKEPKLKFRLISRRERLLTIWN